jgi:hypothetical protein
MRLNNASLICGIIAAVLAIEGLFVVDSTRFVMLAVSIPLMVSMIVITMGNARSMSRKWNSFVISSGVVRRNVIFSLFVPPIIVYLIIVSIMMMGSLLLSGDVGREMLNCAPVACIIVSIATVFGIMSFAMSGSSLFSDILGVAVPIMMIMIGYCYHEYDIAFDSLSIAVSVIVALIMIVLGWRVSVSGFRRLDL